MRGDLFLGVAKKMIVKPATSQCRQLFSPVAFNRLLSYFCSWPDDQKQSDARLFQYIPEILLSLFANFFRNRRTSK